MDLNQSRVDLNQSRVYADCMDAGMLFQHRGPATEKARLPKQVFEFRTFRSPFKSDRRRAPVLYVDTPTQYDSRYSGAAPWKDETGIRCFSTSNNSDCMQLLTNRSWQKHLLTSCQTWSVNCRSAQSVDYAMIKDYTSRWHTHLEDLQRITAPTPGAPKEVCLVTRHLVGRA